uniref:Essential protein Yae1 N-terminal domain-containing protein n=1 Tax=Balaenoptera musculus TaxID=9771 RepID=A0A8C0CTY6_BALMU
MSKHRAHPRALQRARAAIPRGTPPPAHAQSSPPPLGPEGVAGVSGAGASEESSVMSWFRAAPLAEGPGEEGDVFDEEADESVLVHREWRSHMQRRVKEGYRDGIDAGKAVTLQQGFNQGYKEGAEVIINYGQLRGTLRIKDCLHECSSGTGVRDVIHVHSAAHKPHLFGKHETSDLITGHCYRQGSNQGTT